ncbi:MAG: response regulator [Acidobacteriota bacterium]|nr:response regulator [Acidobacteriota bacterium]
MTEKKILIVDYDARSLEALAEMLSSSRLTIIRAADGQEAYDLFLSENPDCVVLEAILPKIHGFDLTRRIHQESNGRVPVIIVTGLYRGPQYRHEALSCLGAADYFEKPVDPGKFRAAIQKLLRDDEDIDEDLPNADDVIAGLTRRIHPRPGKKSSKSEGS